MIGETAALVTAVCWALSSVFFTATTHEIGALAVNRIRLVFAVVFLLITHILLTGQILPIGAEPYRWFWLGLSGIIGLVLGDTFLFQAYKLIGNRLGTLIMASVPVISSLGAWLFLSENLSLRDMIGITICILGISMVVLERGGSTSVHATDRQRYLLGILYALGGALGQAAGLILAKMGLGDNFPSISGVMIRMLIALLVMWGVTLLTGQARATFGKFLHNRATMRNLVAGSLVGPFIGVWLSQIAVQNAYVGVSSTLMALTPIVMLPIARWYYKEMISPRSIFGTLLALAGVAVIFL
jgi:drug/metabolite transporter (DMT)-like permease